ncbi:unnamed protein product [Ilex paraguariensis]|uniref:Uncharacterized protein n=1 Tax=Ilex paraguariensis TaxID=185542 RepID=A0ABC8RTV4_9AQUA
MSKIHKPFRFEAYWIDEQQCGEVIRDSWSVDVNGSTMYRLKQRLRNCTTELKRWSLTHFKNNRKQIENLKDRLVEIQNGHVHNTAQNEAKEIKAEVDKIWKREEMYWCQRSRLNWLKYGDRNTKFFHTTTSQRRQRNKIIMLKDREGGWVTDME